jgi:hypothetical protein
MVREAALIGILAALPMNAIAQSACGGPRQMTVCESELYQAGITWEGRAQEGRAILRGCMDKLRVRTSTVINQLVIPATEPVEASLMDQITLMTVIGVSGLGLGVIMGLLLSR